MRAAFLALVLCTVAACGGPAAASPTVPPLSSPVEGVVTAVDSAGLADVRGFTLRTADGRTLSFEIGRLENGAEFPPGHLSEHIGGLPVRVFFRNEGGRPVAYRLEDAG